MKAGLLAGFALAAALVVPMAAAAETALRRGNGPEPESLDPVYARSVTDQYLAHDFFEGLLALDAAGHVIPGVAESWATSPDQISWRFTLRADARWSDGTPVTARDFVTSLRRAVDPATAAAYAPILVPIKGAKAIIAGALKPDQLGVEAPDDRTLLVTLERPTPYLLGLLAQPIAFPVPQGVVAAKGRGWTQPEAIVVNGAYKPVEWVPQSKVVAVKNPAFRDARSVAIDRVIYLHTDDSNEEIKAYRAGQLQISFDVPGPQIPWAEQTLGAEFRNTPYLGTYYLAFNLTAAPFRDSFKLRQALSLALDRDVLTARISQGGELPAYGWVPPGIEGYQSQIMPMKAMSPEDRLAESKRLYAEAGYSRERPLQVEILYNTSKEHKRLMLAIAAMWDETLGVKTSLTNQEMKVYLKSRDAKEFQLCRAAWVADFADPINFLDMFLTEAGGRNPTGYQSAEFDRLVAEAQGRANPAERMALLAQAERKLMAEAPLIPIYFYTTQHLVHSSVKGWQDNVLDIHPTRFLSLAP